VARLCPQAQLTCLIGWVKLQRDIPYKLFGWLEELGMPESDCVAKSMLQCRIAVGHIASQIWHEDVADEPILHMEWLSEHTSEVGLCVGCAKTAERRFKESREKLWALLPSYFGLPPWEELRDFSM